MQSDKSALRRQILDARHRTAPEVHHAIDAGIFRQLTTLESWRKARTIFLYCSTAEEVGTAQLMEDALQQGKRVCVPLCTEKKGEMYACEIQSVSQLAPGHFGIPEPPGNAPRVPPQSIDLCIVPCLAADPFGNRLGYGGGYYDRFLAQTTAETIVLCPENCFLSQLPAEPHDRRCNRIVTERQVHIAR